MHLRARAGLQRYVHLEATWNIDMLAFGICVSSEERAKECVTGIRSSVDCDVVVIECHGFSSICKAYNAIIERVTEFPEIEALVLMHEDVLIRDRHFADRIRSSMRDPRVGIVGAIGARDVSSLRWWDSTQCYGSVTERRFDLDHGGGSHDVHSLDGLLLALSPWALRNLRFDANTYKGFHGYDADICFESLSQGRRVRVVPLDLYHDTKGGFGDEVEFVRSDMLFRRKWEGTPWLSAERGSGKAGLLWYLRYWSVPMLIACRRLRYVFGVRKRRWLKRISSWR